GHLKCARGAMLGTHDELAGETGIQLEATATADESCEDARFSIVLRHVAGEAQLLKREIARGCGFVGSHAITVALDGEQGGTLRLELNDNRVTKAVLLRGTLAQTFTCEG